MGSQEVLSSQIQLLPGIPNEITLDHIAPKLPWRAFHMLSSVSQTWQQAIQSRQVYDARVRSQSTDRVVGFLKTVFDNEDWIGPADDFSGYVHRIALYSLRDKCCFQLPPITKLPLGIPRASNCISLDGKLYILGGFEGHSFSNCNGGKVDMLDLAGQGKWKECASMQEPRHFCGCGVMGGKIYVIGGIGLVKFNIGSEVYDTKLDAWSPIIPMKTLRYSHDVTTVGEKFFVHGGLDHYRSSENVIHQESQDCKTMDFFLSVYHPDKNDWREVRPVDGRIRRSLRRVFMAQGKFHFMTDNGIYVQDTDENVWSLRHTFPSAAIAPLDSRLLYQPYVLAVDDELFAIVNWRTTDEEGSYLLQSRWFGSKNKEILWEKADYFRDFTCTFQICPMQL